MTVDAVLSEKSINVSEESINVYVHPCILTLMMWVIYEDASVISGVEVSQLIRAMAYKWPGSQASFSHAGFSRAALPKKHHRECQIERSFVEALQAK